MPETATGPWGQDGLQSRRARFEPASSLARSRHLAAQDAGFSRRSREFESRREHGPGAEKPPPRAALTSIRTFCRCVQRDGAVRQLGGPITRRSPVRIWLALSVGGGETPWSPWGVRRPSPVLRGVAQPGSAPALGAGGRWFESTRLDLATRRDGGVGTGASRVGLRSGRSAQRRPQSGYSSGGRAPASGAGGRDLGIPWPDFNARVAMWSPHRTDIPAIEVRFLVRASGP